MPVKNNSTCEQLLSLIGQQLVYQQQQCEIIELLDGCELVLQVLENESSIQATQYGEGHRTVPVTYILPIFDGEGTLHPDLIAAGFSDLIS
ncbi:MAG: hypothetical protein HRT92_06225 [Piscirickettsiaceae bacterium]|nr:hypothetical protein [Piscirickettsiaceae bacterium]